jgi:broad specificity phosphatase PhoE
VRHGQSAGNVARDAAHEANAERIALAVRDADVPLSELGEEQSRTLGRWMANLPEEEKPDVVLVSPYVRARSTAELIAAMGGVAKGAGPAMLDERLREKEFGILDGFTTLGIAATHPQQAEFRRLLGKFYHRAPGGESWADVILRLRSALDTLSLHYSGRRVLIVSHQVVVLCCRYLLENLDEERILAIDRKGDIANCGVTEYCCEEGVGPQGSAGARMILKRYNFTAPLTEAGTRVTRMPDAKVAVR